MADFTVQVFDTKTQTAHDVLYHDNGDGTASPVHVTQGITGGVPVAVVSSGALTNRSGTITAGGTAQDAMAANAARKYARITNPINATESLWVNDAGTAAAASPSEELPPGDSYETGLFAPTGAISVFAATTGHAYSGREG